MMKKNLLLWLFVAIILIWGFETFNTAGDSVGNKNDYVAFKED